MFSASISVVFTVSPPACIMKGRPAVSARFWSKSLKPLVRDRNVQMVIDGMMFGIVMFQSVFQLDAPSIFGGLQHILRDCLQACDINDHHIAYLLPAHEDDQSPEAVFGFQHDGCVEVAEDAVEDHEPDIAQNDATDEVRHEENGTEDVRALDTLSQNVGNSKGQNVDDEQGYEREQRRIPEGVEEPRVRKIASGSFSVPPTSICWSS